MTNDTQEFRIERLIAASKKAGSDTALARLLGYSNGSFIGQMKSRHRPIKEDFVEKLEALPGYAGWFTASSADAAAPVSMPTSDRDDIPPGYVRLQHLSPTPSMGPGRGMSEPVQIIRHLDVLESWVRQKVGSTNYDRIKILTGIGQSMLPTIRDHDLVFVDMGQKSIDVPGIYVLDVYDRLLLKRALIHSTGTLVLRSDNAEEFPDEERIDLRTAADSINVAGRVKAWWTLHQG